jgi:hypothetical protein
MLEAAKTVAFLGELSLNLERRDRCQCTEAHSSTSSLPR